MLMKNGLREKYLTLMNTVLGLNGAYFGQNATLLSPDNDIIRVGDEIGCTLKESSEF